MSPIDNLAVQRKCEEFLRTLDVPCFVIFGWEKDDGDTFGIVSSFHQMPVQTATKALAGVLHEFVDTSL